MIGRFCRYYSLPLPGRYRRQARKAYLAFAKCRKHTAKKVRAAIRKQLGYVRRDIGYLEQFMSEDCVPDKKDMRKKQEYQDNTDRIEVGWTFSLSKRCYGMGLIVTKLEETQMTTIALSVFVTNLFKIQRRIHSALLQVCQF